MSRTIAIIQARMGSSRLPGKVLLDLGGQPMLARVVERVRQAHLLDEVVVAIPADIQDNPIEEFCRQRAYLVSRGSLNDVLDRFYKAACQARAEVVVRLTADCPVIDPDLIDKTIQTLGSQNVDLATNRLPPPWKRTYPIGLDVEVCTFTTLEVAWKNADQKYQREHVMPYIYEGVKLETAPISIGISMHGFKIAQLNHTPDYGDMRWTVDTAEDLELLRRVYIRFGSRNDFSWEEVLSLFLHEPELIRMNANVQHKTAFDVDKRNT